MDDRAISERGGVVIFRAADLGIDLGLVPSPRTPGGMQLLGGCRGWIAAEDVAAGNCDSRTGAREANHLDHFREVFRGQYPCPGCEGRTLRRNEYCLRCNAFGLDGKAELPGEPVGSRLNEGWEAEPTKYRPNGKLRGGKK